MILYKLCQLVIHTYMQTTLAFFYQDKEVTENENVLNKEFENVCKWYADNKLSIDLGGTKCILFSKERNLLELDIIYNNNRIKRFHIV